MKITYTADDGSVFNTSDECLAYEEQDSERFENWRSRLVDGMNESDESLWHFLQKIKFGEIEFESSDDFWTYRRRFIELAKSFEEMN